VKSFVFSQNKKSLGIRGRATEPTINSIKGNYFGTQFIVFIWVLVFNGRKVTNLPIKNLGGDKAQ
jgi:hypothetical protein